ncbi:MAG: 16S rRNA (cytosine(1402)-N(4))-methyltransferase RsmH [Patescibacteria group bacterium]
MNNFHKPVLLKEVIEYLNVRKDSKYIDATLGGGGHTEEILKLGGKVLGIDVDKDALDFVRDRITQIDNSENLTLFCGNFKDIDTIAHLNNFDKVSGIILDLGVSSHQIDTLERGFSYQKNGPLDMRMDKNLSIKAADLLQILTKGELNELFNKLGEEYSSRRISERIVSARRIKKLETTDDLLRAILGNDHEVSAFERARILSKIFQALRIAVNDELNNLREVLPKAIDLLDKSANLLIISFHSLEDRIVKKTFEEYEKKGIGEILTKKPIIPSLEEIKNNSRSRSSKLRIFKKI